jgi:hypothetical protein
MTKTIEELIGKHPILPDFFAEWLDCEDMPIPIGNPNKKHRKLDAKESERQKAIEQVALWLIKHHIRESTLYDYKREKKKQKYDKHGFSKFINSQKHLPTLTNPNTQKGNLGEVVFYQYLHKITQFENLIYKLRYSTNTDQAMKGDDILLFNTKNLSEKVIIGESKFRSIQDGSGIEEIISSFNNEDKLPESITFVSGVLRDLGEKELSNNLSRLQTEIHNRKIPLLYIGFFMSNQDAHKEVENHDLYGNFSINQRVIDELNNLYKPFPIDLTTLIGSKYKNFTILKDKINIEIEKYDKNAKKKSIEKNETPPKELESLYKIDKNVRGFKETIDQNLKTDQNLINKLYLLGFPQSIDLKKLIGKKLNDQNLKSIAPNVTIDLLDKGYENTIYEFSDKNPNDKLVCLTFAMINPEKFVEESFEKANELLINIEQLPIDYKKSFQETIEDFFDYQKFKTLIQKYLNQDK